MDEEYLIHLFRILDSTEASIKGTSNYCSLNYTSAERISQLLSQALYEARKDRKLLFWYVLYEIIAESQTKGHTEFIKYLGMHLRQICTHFATYIDKYDDMKSIKAIISKWKEDKIFQPVYCESLKMILLPKYKELYANANKYEQKSTSKYDKSFIANYKKIQSNELTKKIYMQLSISGETAIKINQFQSDSRLDNLENMDNDKLASLMEEANQCKSALEAQIINFQDLYQETSGKAFNLLNEYILDHQKQSQDSNAILQENNKIQEE